MVCYSASRPSYPCERLADAGMEGRSVGELGCRLGVALQHLLLLLLPGHEPPQALVKGEARIVLEGVRLVHGCVTWNRSSTTHERTSGNASQSEASGSPAAEIRTRDLARAGQRRDVARASASNLHNWLRTFLLTFLLTPPSGLCVSSRCSSGRCPHRPL
ncbi:hypothetical protein HPB50_003525 [Hyalomma asiaticum]|uniref:Uncharacterized protein n=1 Tax=Hyalomma asiaticum TaxID=266040 RepID=A0ACB7SSR9_HYAAI|nr:hypothetical protein HPB50_003525 [Hyalomma asiaticum]